MSAGPLFHPLSEAESLTAFREFCMIDTAPEEELDDLARLAARICEAPIALITLVSGGRQWIRSKVGLDMVETEAHMAFCSHTIEQGEILVVTDAAIDARFSCNPLVTAAPHIRFYAGAPLLTLKGDAIGLLCVLDTAPRELKPDQELALRVLSRQVVTQLELRYSDARRVAAEEALQRSRAELERATAERVIELQEVRSEAASAHREVIDILERVNDGLVSFDKNWRYTYVNEKAAELLGRRAEELLGKHLWTEFPEGAEQPIYRAYCQSLAEQRPITVQTCYEAWGRWFESRIHPSQNGILMFFQEITNQKKAEEHLEREKHLSEAVIACLPGLFYLFDEQGHFLRWNKQTEEITGLTGEELARTHPLDMIAPADHALVEAGILRTFSEGESKTEARIRSKDGTDTWHLCSGKRITVDGRMCLVGLAVDISEQKCTEALLREAQTSLELAVRASGIGLGDWDVVRHRIVISPEWRGQFGVEGIEIENPFDNWKSRLHPEDRDAAVARLTTYLENPCQEYESEARLRHDDGLYRWVFTRARMLCDEHGNPLRMLGCHIDVTQHRQTEERLLQQREQLRALAQHLNSVREDEAGRIARELHDELGAALTGLKIDINRLGLRLDKDAIELQRAHIQSILSSIDSTIHSVRKICLDLRPAVLDQLGLSAAVEWLVAEFQRRTGIACQLRQPENVPISSSSAITIFRIFQELLTNITRHAEATRVTIDLRNESDKIVLEIDDNGRGLPTDALTRHDRFGLLSVRERVLTVGGRVDFSSIESGGTRVVVSVPLE